MPERHFGRRDIALALLICIVWAGNFLTSAHALQEIPPFLFSALRMVILAVLLCAFVRLPPRVQWPRLIAVALLNGALHFGTSLWALRMAGDLSSPAIVIAVMSPASTSLCWPFTFNAATAPETVISASSVPIDTAAHGPVSRYSPAPLMP